MSAWTKRGMWAFSVAAALMIAGCIEAFDVPEAETPEGQAFVRRCSLCHALPDPTRMEYVKWVAVVGRMTQKIRSQNVPQMPPEELEQILTYLKRHAKPLQP